MVETVARLIKQHQRSVKAIVASIYDDEAPFEEAGHAGAEGFILKRRAVVDLIPAIERVCQGRRHESTGDYGDKDRDGK